MRKFILAVSALSMIALPAAADAHRHHGYDNENGYSRGDDQDDDQGDEQQRGYYQQQGYYPQQRYSQQQGYYQQQAYNNNGYNGRSYGYSRHRCSGTTGTLIGGGAGALLGRSLGRGSGYYHQNSGTTGTIIGGVLGALAGRQVGKATC